MCEVCRLLTVYYIVSYVGHMILQLHWLLVVSELDPHYMLGAKPMVHDGPHHQGAGFSVDEKPGETF